MHKPSHPAAQSGRVPPPKKRPNRKKRNWHRIIRRTCAVVFAAEVAALVFANPYLRVTHVRVEGLRTLAARRVAAEARVPHRTNIFLMWLRPSLVRGVEADPVVDHASRAIALPHTLVLRVTERRPYATLSQGGAYWLLDRKGVPYRALGAPFPGTPVLELPSDAPVTPVLGRSLQVAGLPDAYRLLALVRPCPGLGAAKIQVDQNANLCLNRKDNLKIKLGQPDSLPQKVSIAQATVAADGGQIARRAAYIDVSCPEQPVWMPRAESSMDRHDTQPDAAE